jgi:cell division protein FtsL
VTPTEPGWDRAAGRGGAGLAGTGLLDPEPANTGLLDTGLLDTGPSGGELLEPGHVDGGADSPSAPSRRDREEQQRHLRLVQNQARRRAGRRRLLVVLGIATVAVVGLALVGLHVLIAENQFRLDRLQQQASTEQAGYEKLRLQVAQLEAPARIVSQAEGRLGMVQPATVTYLPATTSGPATTATTATAEKGRQNNPTSSRSASPAGRSRVSAPAAADPPTTGVVAAPQGDSDWPSVKPYLSGSP